MSWACAITFWHRQEEVIEQLIKANFEYFFPRIRHTVRHRGKRAHRFEPLLFNYLPVRLSEGWQAIHDMRGANGARLVTDMIGPVHEDEIQKLKARCDADGVLVAPPQFKVGQQVRPVAGALAGVVGVYQGCSRDEREAVLFDILGAKRRIEFEADDLVAA